MVKNKDTDFKLLYLRSDICDFFIRVHNLEFEGELVNRNLVFPSMALKHSSNKPYEDVSDMVYLKLTLWEEEA